MLLQTSIHLSILEITASNFQGMLLRNSTLQGQHPLDFDQHNHKVLLSYPGPNVFIERESFSQGTRNYKKNLRFDEDLSLRTRNFLTKARFTVKWLWLVSRSGPTFCRTTSRSKLFANVYNEQTTKSMVARKELNTFSPSLI